MPGVREIMSKPAVGWTVAGVAVLFAVVVLWRSLRSSSPYDPARLSQMVTVRFSDTGEEVKLIRAEFERQLRETNGELNTGTGIVNPKTGKASGVLVASQEWEEVVHRINDERAWAQQNSPFGTPPSASSQSKKK